MAALPHPVSAVLHDRAAAGSLPGARDDPHRVALVLEGGGMRGIVSAGMAAALERLDLTRCLDLVVGASAGALNGAALVAGVAARARGLRASFATREFINPARLLRGRPALDVGYALRHAGGELDRERHGRTIESPIPLHCLAVDVETAETVVFTGHAHGGGAVGRAARLQPDAVGRRRSGEIRGRRYLDGGLASPIPIDTAIAAGATHVLVLQTRPLGVRARPACRSSTA